MATVVIGVCGDCNVHDYSSVSQTISVSSVADSVPESSTVILNIFVEPSVEEFNKME